ncbi:SMP-30/gluconolactonase/LRE family protein [Micromonospora sp. HM5-17]|uniref:SMP-30/gluconolactonase/LRE family protein n=1 Tax=Micromonospora sp. HM5-17 TaxID=2487710 RepID=UPI000F49C3DE|nr:hypothetical protein EF879_21570 [Micromonospora sp. HM5-17]
MRVRETTERWPTVDGSGRSRGRRPWHCPRRRHRLGVDTDGCLWGARWDGWSVHRLAPDGARLARVAPPVPRPTAVCWSTARPYAPVENGDVFRPTLVAGPSTICAAN